jgi:hypothetical protein
MSTNNNDTISTISDKTYSPPISKASDNNLETEGYTVSQSYFFKAIRFGNP